MGQGRSTSRSGISPARSCGASVSELLGGYRKRLPAYASTYHGDRNGGAATARRPTPHSPRQCYELGYRAFKIHGWNDGDAREEARERAARRQGRRRPDDADARSGLRAAHLRRCALRRPRLRRGAATSGTRTRFATAASRPSPTQAARDDQDAAAADRACARRRAEGRLRTSPAAPISCASIPSTTWASPGAMKIAHLAEALGLDCRGPRQRPGAPPLMSAMRNSNYYEVALVGPDCPNAMPPVYTLRLQRPARMRRQGWQGRRPDGAGPRRRLRLGLDRGPSHRVARIRPFRAPDDSVKRGCDPEADDATDEASKGRGTMTTTPAGRRKTSSAIAKGTTITAVEDGDHRREDDCR